MMTRRSLDASRAAAAFLLAGVSCLGPASPPEFTLDPNADVTALFIGNSLTASNNLPALVQGVAEAAGRSFDYAALLAPGVSLEEHWNGGAAGVIQDLRPDVVILQQGPSSLPESQEHLRVWTEQFAGPIREAGGRPALFMVWPEASRMEAFDAVSESYRAAAEAVDGLFIPAGDAWRAVWERDAEAALYGADGFHPSLLGSAVAAISVYAVLFDADVSLLAGSAVPGVSQEILAVVLDAVAEVVSQASAGAPSW